MTDEQLLQGCIEKNLNAQKHLYELYARKMMGVCIRYVNDPDDAQDLLQEGFIKVFEKISSFKGTGSLEGWIKKIMVNTALDNLRRNKNAKLHVDINQEDVFIKTDEEVHDNLSVKELLKLIHQLPDGYRTVFNLYAIEGYSHKEIGDMLGVTESTSKSQYSRARLQLQKAIQLEKVF